MPGASSIPPPAVESLPRLGVRDPDFWLSFAAWTVIVLSAVQILLFSFGRDQGIYAVIADGILDGKVPYRDLWDFKPPGIYLVYALSEALFGRTMLAPRMLEVAGLLLMVFGFIRLADVFFGNPRVGLVSGALAALSHAEFEFWHTGQPESFGGFLTVAGLVLTVTTATGWKRWASWIGVGAIFGCAALLKPPLGGGALVCAAYLARSEQSRRDDGFVTALRPIAALLIGGLVPVLVCVVWFVARGGWEALRWTMLEFTPGYTKLGLVGRDAPQTFYWALEELFFKFSAINAAGFLAALLISPMHGREREGLFLVLGVISVHLAGICMQGKFFAYHYAATMPFVAFIGGLGMYKLWRRCLAGGAAGVIVFALFVIVTAQMRQAAHDLESFWERSSKRIQYLLHRPPYETREQLDHDLYAVADYSLDGDRQLAREIQRLTPTGAAVYVWGFEPIVYRLAERRPASRFIYDVPQRVTWNRERARRTLMEDLSREPPAVIALERGDVFPAVTGDGLDSRDSLPSFPELYTFITRDYELVSTVDDFDVYERKTTSEAPPSAPAPPPEPVRPVAPPSSAPNVAPQPPTSASS